MRSAGVYPQQQRKSQQPRENISVENRAPCSAAALNVHATLPRNNADLPIPCSILLNHFPHLLWQPVVASDVIKVKTIERRHQGDDN
jgi:hypothetical protein